MMASSQVEIATTSPFGCHNRRFQVTSNDNSHQIDLTDLWVHHPQWQDTTTTVVNTDSNYDDAIDRSIDYQPVQNKDKWARAREIVFPPRESESSKEVSNSRGGVFSLVQKWRGLETEARSCSKATSAATTVLPPENAVPEPPVSEPAVSVVGNNDDDSIGDWESDRNTVCSAPSSCRGRDSDFTESERLRVADIIRKLTVEHCNDTGSESPPRDQRCSSPVAVGVGLGLASPRIRGRQAYIDLLKQMERDRGKELERLIGRKAVSQFSHRGRIQALLRIRFLRRSMEAKDGRLSSDSPKANKSTPTYFRERGNGSAQNGSAHFHKELTDKAPDIDATNKVGNENKYQEVANSKSCNRVGEEPTQDSKDVASSKEHDIHPTSPEANKDIQQNANLLHSHEHQASPFSKFNGQETNMEGNNYHTSDKSAEMATMFHNTEIRSAQTSESLHEEGDRTTDHQVTEINYDFRDGCADTQNYHDEESTSNQHIVESDAYWVSDVSHTEAGWEELQSDYEQKEVSRSDWIGEVSRPRSDWEDLRQARYQEMLDPFVQKEEIRALLDRKSVSTFLSSSMREKIDQLMICRFQGNQTLNNNQRQEVKHEALPEQRQAATIASEEGEGEDGENEHDEEGESYGDYFDESSTGQQYNESDEYMDHMTSSPPALWPQTQGQESSVSSVQQSPSNYYSEENGPDSSHRVHPAIDMELIYDLRRHMEQLHQEMSELRKSMKCCTDMQIKLQRSIKKEVATALTNAADKKNGRWNPARKGANGGRCCVCCKVQVDCVLYRCGHMCTCFQCAHELQWSSGKCPICRAPIMDVVRTYSNY